MVRATTPRGEVAKERILEHAIQIFSQRGFDGFTTRELSARAKVNVAAISYYFGHKQGLYEAAIDEVYRRFKARGEQLFTERHAEHPRDLVRSLYQAAREEAAGMRLLLRRAIDEGAQPSVQPNALPGTERLAMALSKRGLSLEQVQAKLYVFNALILHFVVQGASSYVAGFGVKTAEQAEDHVLDILVSAVSEVTLNGPRERTFG